MLGIRDAVIQDAPFDLLDSYQTEREPHVRTIIETAIAMGRIVLAGTPWAGEIFPQPVIDGERLDDRIGPGPALIGRRLPLTQAIAGFDLDEGALAPFAQALSAWLEGAGAQAVLVRPDRYVFGIGEPQALLEAWRLYTVEKAAA